MEKSNLNLEDRVIQIKEVTLVRVAIFFTFFLPTFTILVGLLPEFFLDLDNIFALSFITVLLLIVFISLHTGTDIKFYGNIPLKQGLLAAILSYIALVIVYFLFNPETNGFIVGMVLIFPLFVLFVILFQIFRKLRGL